MIPPLVKGKNKWRQERTEEASHELFEVLLNIKLSEKGRLVGLIGGRLALEIYSYI